LPPVAVLAAALAVRLAYLWQVRPLPWIEYPFGDSGAYFLRASQIMGGDLAGGAVPFLGSVLYPYFLALVMSVGMGQPASVLVLQAVIGSFGCVMIGWLSGEACRDRWAFLAGGLAAALYGPLVFLDVDLVMTSLTIAAVSGSLLLMLASLRGGGGLNACLAGVLLGIGALDRANLLLFVPAGAWFLWQETGRSRLRRPLLYAVGAVIPLLPFFVNNLANHGDPVLTSSGLGINFYIGNNEQAPGVFYLPPGSGLVGHDLSGSSRRLAEQQAGRDLKASQVSNYWLTRGISFIRENPGPALKLALKKLGLMLNRYEVPNHLNFYFARRELGSALRVSFLGFGIIGALGLAGLAYFLWRFRSPAVRLYAIFIATYILSLVPFFVADRYRIPMVPPLIALAASFALLGARTAARKSWPQMALISSLLVLSGWLVNRSLLEFPFSSDRIEVARSHLERAINEGNPSGGDIREALTGLNWALEASGPNDPWRPYGHFHLGRAYAFMGLYSAALEEFARLEAIGGASSPAASASRMVLEEYSKSGDAASRDQLPRTMFEEAETRLAVGDYQSAIAGYRTILKRDPFHYSAINRLGLAYHLCGLLDQSLRALEEGLRRYPDDATMLENARQVALRLNRPEKALKLLRRYGK
jgi:tetratricopeptide (TPR) repeat protein